jgi:hypothetical protein
MGVVMYMYTIQATQRLPVILTDGTDTSQAGEIIVNGNNERPFLLIRYKLLNQVKTMIFE